VARLPRGRPVWTPEFPGFGGAAGEEPDGIDGFADRVAERIGRRASGGRAVVAGASMGGYAALSLAARHPGRVAALGLVDTRAEPDDDEGRRAREEGARRVRAQGVAAFVDDFLPRLVAPGDGEALGRAREIALDQAPEAIARALLALAGRADRRPDLAAIDVPAIVLVGERDAVTPPPVARSLAAGLPRAELRVVPGAGHLTPLEAPEAVAAALGDLAERAEAPRE
jgi:pimeloyl-ACP methyl ester carboxylesterase